TRTPLGHRPRESPERMRARRTGAVVAPAPRARPRTLPPERPLPTAAWVGRALRREAPARPRPTARQVPTTPDRARHPSPRARMHPGVDRTMSLLKRTPIQASTKGRFFAPRILEEAKGTRSSSGVRAAVLATASPTRLPWPKLPPTGTS